MFLSGTLGIILEDHSQLFLYHTFPNLIDGLEADLVGEV